MRRLIPICVVLLAGCGGSPTAPTPPPQPGTPFIGATWAGAYTVALNGTDLGARFTATLTQQGAHVAGPWTGTDFDSRGTFDGMITGTGTAAQFAGTFTIDAPSDAPNVRCQGTAQIAGPVLPAIRWTSERVTIAPGCDGELTNLRISLGQ